MWLSGSGNLRVDDIGDSKFRLYRWNQAINDWQDLGITSAWKKTMEYIRVMRMTEYPDVPDFPPEELWNITARNAVNGGFWTTSRSIARNALWSG